MFVRHWMTERPVTADEKMDLGQAFERMHQHRIRRLPVVREGNKLCGIIALSDLYPYIGPQGLNRAIMSTEFAAKLRCVRVSEIMVQNPVTCDRNTPLEEAGALMRNRKIGAIPVVHGDEIVGIITESDVLEALTKIAQMGEDGKRVCFRIPVDEKMKIFYRIVSLCEQNRLEILTLLTHPLADGSHLVMIRIRGEKISAFIDALWDFNYKVLTAMPD